jgi:hypothetical protein
MKKTLVLKLVLLAMLSYVAIMPSSTTACDRGECVTFDDGSPGCATYGENGYFSCGMLSIETSPGNWSNYCFIYRC